MDQSSDVDVNPMTQILCVNPRSISNAGFTASIWGCSVPDSDIMHFVIRHGGTMGSACM